MCDVLQSVSDRPSLIPQRSSASVAPGKLVQCHTKRAFFLVDLHVLCHPLAATMRWDGIVGMKRGQGMSQPAEVVHAYARKSSLVLSEQHL